MHPVGIVRETASISAVKIWFHSLWTVCVLSALCLCINGPVTAKRNFRLTRSQPILTYQVVELGPHRFLNQVSIPKDVMVLLSRRGIGGFLLSDTNAHGEHISNHASPPYGKYKGYLSHGRTRRPLRPIYDFNQCSALGMNDRGDVVGTSWEDDSSYTAVLWRHGRVYDLSKHCTGKWGQYDGPSPFGRAVAINNKGQIVAMSIDGVPNASYYLLLPASATHSLKNR